MSQLDKLIERIQPGQELLLESQKEPMMRSSAGLKVMVNQPLTSPQIVALLAELAPADQKQNVTRKQPATFEYALGDKRYTVSFLTQGELVRGVISQAEAAAEAATALADIASPPYVISPYPRTLPLPCRKIPS